MLLGHFVNISKEGETQMLVLLSLFAIKAPTKTNVSLDQVFNF
jgi:hypothetical protein